MRIQIIDNKGKYTTGSVKRLIKSYLKIIKVSWEDFWKALFVPNVRLVFLLAINDFKKGKISLDQLSTIADYLYYADNKWSPWEIDLSDKFLSSSLEDASELAYYNWRKKDPQSYASYKLAFGRIEEYYEKNKQLIENMGNM
jgi:hypothetical protein